MASRCIYDMMDFKGKEELIRAIKEQGTLRDTLIQIAQYALQLAIMYDPAGAEQLAAMIQGIAGDMGAQVGGGIQVPKLGNAPDDASSAPHDPRENKIVRRAAEQSANASRPS